MTEIIIAVLGGSALSAVINQIGNYLSDRRKRKDTLEDRTEDKDAAIKQGMKLLLADKLQFLGLKFISEGEITFSNRKMLHEMHNCYHSGLGGNGDYDNLIEEIDELPLRG